MAKVKYTRQCTRCGERKPLAGFRKRNAGWLCPQCQQTERAMIDRVSVQVTKTADGLNEYVQIMSADQLSVNVVVVAREVVVQDLRGANDENHPTDSTEREASHGRGDSARR